jgi:hypothetical protein
MKPMSTVNLGMQLMATSISHSPDCLNLYSLFSALPSNRFVVVGDICLPYFYLALDIAPWLPASVKRFNWPL